MAITPTDDIQVSIPDLELYVARETWDLAGDYVIKVEAQLQDYQFITTADVETNLKILTSCLQPVCVSKDYNSCDETSAQITLAPYLYTIGD